MKMKVDDAAAGEYTTHLVTSAVQSWITEQVSGRKASGKNNNKNKKKKKKTFAYVAQRSGTWAYGGTALCAGCVRRVGARG